MIQVFPRTTTPYLKLGGGGFIFLPGPTDLKNVICYFVERDVLGTRCLGEHVGHIQHRIRFVYSLSSDSLLLYKSLNVFENRVSYM